MSKVISRDTKTGKYWMIFPKSTEAKEAMENHNLKLLEMLYNIGGDNKQPTAKEALQNVIELTGVYGFALAFIDVHPSVEERQKWGT